MVKDHLAAGWVPSGPQILVASAGLEPSTHSAVGWRLLEQKLVVVLVALAEAPAHVAEIWELSQALVTVALAAARCVAKVAYPDEEHKLAAADVSEIALGKQRLALLEGRAHFGQARKLAPLDCLRHLARRTSATEEAAHAL